MKHSIWKQSWILVTLLCMAPLCLTPLAWAQDDDLTPRRKLTDWEQIDTHVFQRQLEDGTVETVGTGLEMVAWELGQVNDRIAYLEGLALELDRPSTDLMDALSYHRARARDLEAELRDDGEGWLPPQRRNGELRSMAMPAALGCNIDITVDARAYPTTTGPAASASAAFSDTCGTFGQVRATAYAEGFYNGALRTSSETDPASGRRSGYGSASATAFAQVVATTDCYSQASARVFIQDANGNMAPFVSVATNWVCRIILPNPWECLTSEGLQSCVPEVP